MSGLESFNEAQKQNSNKVELDFTKVRTPEEITAQYPDVPYDELIEKFLTKQEAIDFLKYQEKQNRKYKND